MKKYPSNYVVFDIETTGFDYKKDKIIEIGALKYINDEFFDEFSYLINPEISIPETITKITGITNKDVMNKKSIDEILPIFFKFIDNYPIIGHNVNFDISFINYNAKLLNLNEINTEIIDTLQISRKIIKNKKNHKLQTLKEYLDLNYNSHRAIDDCYTCNEVYNYCRINEGLIDIINI